MRTILLMLPLMLGVAMADGIRMTKDYHFVHKPETCYTLKLTVEQVAELEGKREGEKKLYADLKLTKEQTAFVKEKTGKEITKVLVFEKGWNDCGCCAQNIASRFEPDQIEVSDTYLIDEAELRRWEARMEAVDKEQAAKKAAKKVGQKELEK